MMRVILMGVGAVVFFFGHNSLRCRYPYRVYSGLLYIPP